MKTSQFILISLALGIGLRAASHAAGDEVKLVADENEWALGLAIK